MAWLSLEELKKYDAKEELKKRAKAKQTNTAEKSAVKSVSEGKNIPNTNLFRGLNVSKPEPKKLSGSDKDVFKRASALAADTGMSYAERKKQITQTQKELGKIRDKHLIASMMGNENAKKTIKQVTDLQNQLSQQLKSTAFGAGFGQAAGLDIYDTAVKKIAEKTGNTSLTARMKAQDDARAQVKAANKKSYGRGELAGELTQAAILYGTAGAAAEKAALAGMGRLTGGKTLGKAGTFATRMLGQQTADTVVNTPLTIAKGMEEGKDRGEIAEDVGKQFALDAAFNLGMGAIGAGAKAAGKAIGKAKESKAAGRAMDNAKRVQMDDSANKISSLSDHELLDQKAIVHHLKKNGVPVNKDNTVTLYHVTSPDNAKKIRENGFVGTNAPVGGMTGEELQPRSFFGIDKDWTKQWDSGGYEMIEIRVPAQYVRQGAQNANEVYIEGNIRHIGNGIWEPDTYPTSTFYDRRAVKRYQKDLGNNSVQKEASNVTLEKTEKVNETVGKQALTEADLPELAKESKAAVKTAREEAQREMLEAAAKTPAPTAARRRKAMLSQEDLPELAKEYQLMQDDRWWGQKISEIGQRYGDDTAGATRELEALQARQAELEDMLGIKTKKVQQMENSLKTKAVKQAEGILNLSGNESKAEARKLMTSAMNEAMRNGTISKETRDSIFQQLFEKGGVSNREAIDKELKERLRTLKLTISKQDAANIGDFNLWKQGYQGKIGSIKIAKSGNVNSTYGTLSSLYPKDFPADIKDPSAQLEKIREVAESLKFGTIANTEAKSGVNEMGLREEFDAAMDALEGEVAKITRYTNERAEKQISKLLRQGQLPDYSRADTDSMKALYDERRQLRKEAEKIRNKVNLTEGDKLVLQKLLRGEIKEAEARQLTGINADDLMKLYAVEQPLRKVENSIRGYKEYVSRNAYEGAKGIVGEMNIRGKGVEGWRDLGPMRLMRETQERILDMIAPTKEKAKEITEYLFAPVHENERLRTLFKNDFIDRIKATGISTKNNITVRKADGSTAKTSESALVQYLGESKYQLQKYARRKGWATQEDIAAELQLQKEVQAIEASLTAEQLEKISRGIDEMTAIYKEIHPKINEVLIRNGYDPIGYIEGYFPHMSFDDPDNIMEMAAKKLGFDFASKELPMDIAGRTEGFRPGKKWSGNLLERKGTQTDYDALRAFDMYIDNISDVIYHTDDIKRLRAYEDYIRYTLSEEGIKENVDAIRARTDISIDEKMELIEKEYGKSQEHTLQNYVNNVRLYTDLLAGKKHNIDRILETHLFGRKVYKVVSEIENRVAGNMVAGNIGSAMTNFIPITQGMSSMSTKSNLQGLKEALEYMSKAEMDDLTKKSAFLTTREGSDLLYKTTLREISDKASGMMTLADKFSTQAVWRSRYYDNMAKGMTEDAAIKNADEFARNLFGARSKGAMPTAFSAKALKLLTMFQLEVNNQLSYLLKDIPKEAQGSVRKMMKAYSGIIIGAYVYNDVYEKLTGRRAALDPFGIANDAIGDLSGRQVRNTLDILGDALTGDGVKFTEKTEKKKGAEVYSGLKENITENIPFIGGWMGGGRIPISSALPDLDAIGEANANYATGDITKERKDQIVRKELGKSLAYMALPVAGGQIKKTLQGMETMAKGGSYSQTNNGPELQFAVDQSDPIAWAQSALFGKWATEGGKEYINSGFKDALGTKKTALQKEAQEKFGMSANDYVQLHRELEGKENNRAKLQTLEKTGLSDEAKEFFYQNNILNSDSQKEKYSELRSQGLTFREASDLQVKISTLDDMYEKKLDTEGFGATKAEQKATELYDYIGKMGVNDATKTALQEEYCKSAIQLEAKYQKVQGILTTDEYATLNDYIGTLKGDGVYLLKSRRVKAAIDTNVTGKSRAEMQRLYEAWDVSKKLW